VPAFTKTTVYSSIISGNTLNDPQGLGLDVQRSRQAPLNGNTFESLGYNLVGTGNALLNFNGTGDQTNELDPGLGPLTNNGGKTLTHAPLAGSPAIDAGDPEAVLPGGVTTETSVLVTAYDQRGEPFTRITDGDVDGTARIDIGAIEQPRPAPSGDFDGDGDTDGADFLAWQRGLGKVNAQPADGDANFDGNVDGDDLQVWGEDFGGPIEPAESFAGASRSAAISGDPSSRSMEPPGKAIWPECLRSVWVRWVSSTFAPRHLSQTHLPQTLSLRHEFHKK